MRLPFLIALALLAAGCAQNATVTATCDCDGAGKTPSMSIAVTQTRGNNAVTSPVDAQVGVNKGKVPVPGL